MASPNELKVNIETRVLEGYKQMTGDAFNTLIESMAELSAFYNNEYNWDELLAVVLQDIKDYYSNTPEDDFI